MKIEADRGSLAPDVKSLWIDAELHQELKIRAVETRKSIRTLVEVAVRLYLDGGPGKEGK